MEASCTTQRHYMHTLTRSPTCSSAFDDMALSEGALVRDVAGAVGRMTVLMPRWRALAQLAPEARPRTNELIQRLRAAVQAVAEHPRVAEATRGVARRHLAAWSAPPRPKGERVQWDSD